MNVKHLDYSRLKFLGDSLEPRVTLENMADTLGRSYSGFLKAINAGTIYLHELAGLADLLQMSEPDLYAALSEPMETGSELPKYLKKKRLSDESDPLAWLRLAMTKSAALDKLIEGAKK